MPSVEPVCHVAKVVLVARRLIVRDGNILLLFLRFFGHCIPPLESIPITKSEAVQYATLTLCRVPARWPWEEEFAVVCALR